MVAGSVNFAIDRSRMSPLSFSVLAWCLEDDFVFLRDFVETNRALAASICLLSYDELMQS